jgi:hypothetical protein
MRPARSQEQEDETETELGTEYRIHLFPPEPTRHPFDVLDMVGLAIIFAVMGLFLVAIGLGLRDELHFVLSLFR